MSRHLNLIVTLSRTSGNDVLAYLALAAAVAALPGAALFFFALAALALVRRVLSAVAVAAAAGADQLGELLHSGRVLLAERLRLAADLIDPRPAAAGVPSAPTVVPETAAAEDAVPAGQPAAKPLSAVEGTIDLPAASEPACKAVARADPVLMPAAARVTVAGPAVEAPATDRDTEAERLAEALAAHGTIRGAARVLGIGESTLRGRLKRHGIGAPTRKRGRDARPSVAA
jgi:hypothetical protein